MLQPYIIGLFLLAICSSVAMSIFQRLLVAYSPYIVYLVAFGVATLLSLLAYIGLSHQFTIAIPTKAWMLMAGLGVSLSLLNLGFILLYSQNIPLAYVPLITTGCVTILLGIVGFLFFGEVIQTQFIIGALCILVGVGIIVS